MTQLVYSDQIDYRLHAAFHCGATLTGELVLVLPFPCATKLLHSPENLMPNKLCASAEIRKIVQYKLCMSTAGPRWLSGSAVEEVANRDMFLAKSIHSLLTSTQCFATNGNGPITFAVDLLPATHVN